LDGQVEGRDLVVVALPGVQRFIAEARSTSDVSAASQIYSELAARVVGVLGDRPGGELVLPVPGATGPPGGPPPGGDGMPNRVVALLPAGTGAGAARSASEAAHDAWQAWLRRALRPAEGEPVPRTPGFPEVQWVCVPAGAGGYPEQWRQAQRLLAARRRVRDFAAVPEEEWKRRRLCSLAPRWPAAPEAPPGAPRHERNTPLSAAGWVKRLWRYILDEEGFPSTLSVASAPYRQAVLEHLGAPGVREAVGDLARAEASVRESLGMHAREAQVPGLPRPEHDVGRWLARSAGPWVYPERWRADALAREVAGSLGERAELARAVADAVGSGYQAARRLRQAMDDLRRSTPVAELTNYLAVVVQDLDGMGQFLGGRAPAVDGTTIEMSPNEHWRVSQELLGVARAQREALETPGLLGVPVYAGGDDLLFFCPAPNALAAAQSCHDKIPPSLPAVSTAVLFFHHHASIQQAMSQARWLLKTAKEKVPGKHALAAGYMRRSGVSAVSVQPWQADGGRSSASLFGLFARTHEPRLSPRLVADLERDAGELSSLAAVPGGHYRRELARLVRRHMRGDGAGRAVGAAAAAEIAEALEWLGGHERAPQRDGQAVLVRPQPAAQVGVFLRQEAR
jgi:CRISPR-associated protein Cmr2